MGTGSICAWGGRRYTLPGVSHGPTGRDAVQTIDRIFSFMDKLPSGLLVGIFLVSLLAILVFHLTLPVRRGTQWQKVAKELSLTYSNEDTNIAGTFKDMDSFADLDGFETRSLDVCTGESAGLRIWLFDHSTGTKAKKFQTVCAIRATGLDLPHFHLFPRKPTNARSMHEVAIPTNPDNGNTIFLYGKETERLQLFFTPDACIRLTKAFEGLQELGNKRIDMLTRTILFLMDSMGRYEIEACGDTVAIRMKSIIEPSGASELISTATEITDFFRNPSLAE